MLSMVSAQRSGDIAAVNFGSGTFTFRARKASSWAFTAAAFSSTVFSQGNFSGGGGVFSFLGLFLIGEPGLRFLRSHLVGASTGAFSGGGGGDRDGLALGSLSGRDGLC